MQQQGVALGAVGGAEQIVYVTNEGGAKGANANQRGEWSRVQVRLPLKVEVSGAPYNRL